MSPGDVPAVLYIQSQCYPPEMVEPDAVVSRRLAIAPETAWVAENGSGVCAYLVGYRSQVGTITALGGDFSPVAAGDSLYLHDLAVAAVAAGSGAGRALVEHACAQAKAAGMAFSALVSVQASCVFWQKRGYTIVEALSAVQRLRLESYHGESFYMLRPLAA